VLPAFPDPSASGNVTLIVYVTDSNRPAQVSVATVSVYLAAALSAADAKNPSKCSSFVASAITLLNIVTPSGGTGAPERDPYATLMLVSQVRASTYI